MISISFGRERVFFKFLLLMMLLFFEVYKEILIYDNVCCCVGDRNCFIEISIGFKSRIIEKLNKKVFIFLVSFFRSRGEWEKDLFDVVVVGFWD